MATNITDLDHVVETAGIDKRTGKPGKSRFVFAGIVTTGGKAIRFKSLDRAERHIRNVRPSLLQA